MSSLSEVGIRSKHPHVFDTSPIDITHTVDSPNTLRIFIELLPLAIHAITISLPSNQAAAEACRMNQLAKILAIFHWQ